MKDDTQSFFTQTPSAVITVYFGKAQAASDLGFKIKIFA
jgi:hypothetical protein